MQIGSWSWREKAERQNWNDPKIMGERERERGYRNMAKKRAEGEKG